MVIDGKAGYINASGKLVIAPRFDPYYVDPSQGDFVEGLALVFVGDHLGFINESGQVQNFGALKFNDPYSESFTVANRLAEGNDRCLGSTQK